MWWQQSGSGLCTLVTSHVTHSVHQAGTAWSVTDFISPHTHITIYTKIFPTHSHPTASYSTKMQENLGDVSSAF